MSSGVYTSIDELIRLRNQARSIDLSARRQRLSNQHGGFISPFRGRGMEFDEVRAYQPGDDIRNMDWRVLARTGQPHTKLFREERERPVYIMVDQSARMAFGTRVAFKSVIAARIAAILAWAGHNAGDRIGSLVFNDTARRDLRPMRGKHGVLALLNALCEIQKLPARSRPGSQPPWIDAATRLTRLVHPGSLVIMISDFFGINREGVRFLAQMRQHNDIMMVALNDPLEEQLPPPDRYPFSNGTAVITLDTGDEDIRQRYQRYHANQRLRIENVCKRYRICLVKVATHDALTPALMNGLRQHHQAAGSNR